MKLQEAAAKALGDEAGGVVAMNPNNARCCAFTPRPLLTRIFYDRHDPGPVEGIVRQREKAPEKQGRVRSLPTRLHLQNNHRRGRPVRGGHHSRDLLLLRRSDTFGRRTYRCWAYKKGGHGHTDLKKAIRESCDVYFYKVGLKLGVDRLAKIRQGLWPGGALRRAAAPRIRRAGANFQMEKAALRGALARR